MCDENKLQELSAWLEKTERELNSPFPVQRAKDLCATAIDLAVEAQHSLFLRILRNAEDYAKQGATATEVVAFIFDRCESCGIIEPEGLPL